MVSGLFVPRYFRSSERKFPVGTFARRNESSQELSMRGTEVPGNFCSREQMFPVTFVPFFFRFLTTVRDAGAAVKVN